MIVTCLVFENKNIIMTAEKFFDENHIASKSHLSENGLVYEERAVYEIMEKYYKYKSKQINHENYH